MNLVFIFACILSTVAGLPDRSHPRRLDPSPADARISGGVDVDIREVPYIVALETKGNKARQYCAGALITNSHVLTAGQCLVKPAEKLRIRVGSHKRNSGGTVYDIDKHVSHPSFAKGDLDYDVGIIHLATNVTLGDTVKTIAVSDDPPKPGTFVRIAGWGMKEEDGDLWPTLQKADIPIMDWQKCSDIYRMFLIPVSDRMMCTDGNGIDACVGDGGGPAVVDGAVTGIISWGLGCGTIFPGVQTSVAVQQIRDFIRKEANV